MFFVRRSGKLTIVAMHKGEVVDIQTSTLQELEQFCSLKLFMGHDHAKSVVLIPNLILKK
jgi:hypothetical protein